jgi:hypothetical protein
MYVQCMFIRVFIYVHTYVHTYVHSALSISLFVDSRAFSFAGSSAPLYTRHSSPLALSLLCVRAALFQVCFHRYLFLIFLAFSLDVQRLFSFSLFFAFPPLPPHLYYHVFASRGSLHFFFFF